MKETIVTVDDFASATYTGGTFGYTYTISWLMISGTEIEEGDWTLILENLHIEETPNIILDASTFDTSFTITITQCEPIELRADSDTVPAQSNALSVIPFPSHYKFLEENIKVFYLPDWEHDTICFRHFFTECSTEQW